MQIKATISDVLVPIGPILLQMFAVLFVFAKVISLFNSISSAKLIEQICSNYFVKMKLKNFSQIPELLD